MDCRAWPGREPPLRQPFSGTGGSSPPRTATRRLASGRDAPSRWPSGIRSAASPGGRINAAATGWAPADPAIAERGGWLSTGAPGDPTVQVWDLCAGRLLTTLDTGYEHRVQTLAIAPDETWIATVPAVGLFPTAGQLNACAVDGDFLYVAGSGGLYGFTLHAFDDRC
ncbi:hypothetical protein AB0J82_27240 [Asanoa sp. NPDC049518]|uniref:hypothetical protein n=1 Tax=unclassified Asanoa TaxID=2685164 RepID=UPI003421B798